MFGMVVDMVINLSLGVEVLGGYLFIDVWIVFIWEIIVFMVVLCEVLFKMCIYIIMIIVSILSINFGGGFFNLY